MRAAVLFAGVAVWLVGALTGEAMAFIGAGLCAAALAPELSFAAVKMHWRGLVAWLTAHGYERVGIMGTSLGSCLAMLTMAHEPAIRAGAFNHVSPYFADVVWRGLSTWHVREGLEGHITPDALRRVWMPISPWPFIRRVDGRAVLLIYAKYDLTFPVDLSRVFVAEFDAQHVAHEVAVLPCGHYTTGKAPFKYLDGYALARFFLKRL